MSWVRRVMRHAHRSHAAASETHTPAATNFNPFSGVQTTLKLAWTVLILIAADIVFRVASGT